jgi:hypothetical protein
LDDQDGGKVRRGDLTAENRAWVRHGLLAGPGLGWHCGPNWRPRHGLSGGPGQARALWSTGQAVLGPCFLVSCSGRPIGLGPFGIH